MKKILFLFITVSILLMSCDKDFGDLNVDTKRPSKVAPGPLFSNASKELVDIMTSTNVNRNIFRMLVQQWTETTYIDEAQYNLAGRNIPQNFWNILYVSVLKNLKECQQLIPDQDPAFFPAAVQTNQNACVEILNVYTWSTLVNTYGNIPYTQALDINNVYPAYDDAASVYNDLLTRLENALNSIDESKAGFDSQDLLFGGDMSRWKKFGNSLELRLAMQLADVDAAKAKSIVEKLAGDIILSNDENAAFHYLSSPPNTNPVWVDLVQSGRKDFVAANTLCDYMNGLSDPRVPYYFTTDANGSYTGGIYGVSNNYATYSKPSETLTAPDFESLLFDAAEGHFLLAEAVERGMNVGGTAAAHYEAGIRASMEYWGVPTSEVDAYLARPDVDYNTAPGNWKEKIGYQAWIALYNRGYDAWTTWRRLDYPTLVPPPDAFSDVPVRLTYPVQEQTLNGTNYSAAASAIGGDVVETKLFWDKF
ncbi:MAG: SusD/RagB family nutrient-binding outer membrane lipoprotein [Bacteroidetes bacterium]|nr:MAG: SusD/RagB family nutrient-binding outer membrane lipoprotein [Bacteroidota bacterium]